jgi:hypothetical protein
MPNLIYLTTIRSVDGSEFEVEVIDDSGRLWLKVSDMHRPRRILRFWSTKPDQPQTPSYTLLIDLLQDRLVNIGKLHQDAYDALQFFPSGWDYWADGTPILILRYLSSDEYQSQLQRMKTERLA